MTDRFDLEDKIYDAWQTSKDIDLIFAGLCEKHIDPNAVENALMGLKVIHDLRMEGLWDMFTRVHQLDDYSPRNPKFWSSNETEDHDKVSSC